MRPPYHPPADEIELAHVMHALSDPARLRIVSQLAEAAEECAAAGSDLDLHKSTLSHHYRVLREAGVTRTVLHGRTRLVGLRLDDLNRRFPGLLDSVIAALLGHGVEGSRRPIAEGDPAVPQGVGGL